MKNNLHVHFMGIGGSGISSIAVLAKSMGYRVSGCNTEKTSYFDILERNSISVDLGHSLDHLNDIDILAVSPAIFDLNPTHPELLLAKQKNILMTWQEFSGKYLQINKEVIAIAGTHGKSTTTILAGLMFERANLDPIVQAGTIYNPWGSGVRISKSNYFICEADEFNHNFLNYDPSIIIINNIEMDHPEYFKDFNEFKNSFVQFIKRMKQNGVLIINQNSKGVEEVLDILKDWLQENTIKVIGYYSNEKINFPFYKVYNYEIIETCPEYTEFKISLNDDKSDSYRLGIIGEHNVQNSVGVICAAYEYNIGKTIIADTLSAYEGVSRRTQLVAEIDDIKIYDDYGHHPTAISAVIDTFKETYPKRRIVSIIEPHQISRLKMFTKEFIESFNKADKTIVTTSFLGREKHKITKEFNLEDIISQSCESKVSYIEFDSVVQKVVEDTLEGDIIIVFGAGNSYKLTQQIVSNLERNENKRN